MLRDLSQLLYSVLRRLTVSASSKRNPDDDEQLMNQIVYDSNRSFISGSDIFKRDSCTDAFGTGWSANICTPGTTLCCVNPSQNVPLCQQDLGIGWCCTADGGCYADLASACGQPGAVSCSDLIEGVSEACCPQYTTCAKDRAGLPGIVTGNPFWSFDGIIYCIARAVKVHGSPVTNNFVVFAISF
ncbi:hypothetical protein M409DRAFT_22478 [Zasmidium cellare ATCC 36951]|uniref:Uncharacterized protein n=1 Tax=Zasmidium cellare ATCC 36951 TaxID=1080233 RepID=A0A6A6CJ26_ZASCE|nr:uncharacterized protein M409DRAFT_22478 [Zasmidium cellare ATCC 36951]KAF2167041.1 hypothetical protein M409DRAFT_22478 [Zasmidium cellare ATCC 36951]